MKSLAPETKGVNRRAVLYAAAVVNVLVLFICTYGFNSALVLLRNGVDSLKNEVLSARDNIAAFDTATYRKRWTDTLVPGPVSAGSLKPPTNPTSVIHWNGGEVLLDWIKCSQISTADTHNYRIIAKDTSAVFFSCKIIFQNDTDGLVKVVRHDSTFSVGYEYIVPSDQIMLPGGDTLAVNLRFAEWYGLGDDPVRISIPVAFEKTNAIVNLVLRFNQ